MGFRVWGLVLGVQDLQLSIAWPAARIEALGPDFRFEDDISCESAWMGVLSLSSGKGTPL